MLSDPIKELLNLYYDKFGVTGTKNIEMAEGGSIGPPPGFVDSKKPGLCRVKGSLKLSLLVRGRGRGSSNRILVEKHVIFCTEL